MAKKKSEKVELKETSLKEKLDTLESAYSELIKTVADLNSRVNQLTQVVNKQSEAMETIMKGVEEMFKGGGKEGGGKVCPQGGSLKDMLFMWFMKEAMGGGGKDVIKVAEAFHKSYMSGFKDALKAFALALRLVTKPKLLTKVLEEEEEEGEEEE